MSDREPTDAESAMTGHEIPEQLALKYSGGTNVIMYDEVQAISRAYLQLLAASRLSRRPAEGGTEGVRDALIALIKQPRSCAPYHTPESVLADAIMASGIVSPAATRAAALEEVIALLNAEAEDDLTHPYARAKCDQLIVSVRRLAQGEGGE